MLRGITWTFNATRRRRWAPWLALALLVALVGGAVLAGFSAARRTSTAYPDFSRRYGGDVALFAGGPQPASLVRRPGVHLTYAAQAILTDNLTADGQFIPEADFTVFVTPPDPERNVLHLVSGHLPDAPGQALAGFSLAEQLDLHLGSVLHVATFSRAQELAVIDSLGSPAPRGPRLALRIVGVAASIVDFPGSSPSYTLWVGPSFARRYAARLAVASMGVYRLAGGDGAIPAFNNVATHLKGSDVVYPYVIDDQNAAIEGSIHPQVTAWWLFTLIAAIAGLALVGQALVRQSTIERTAHPTLSALGVTPVQLFFLGMLRAAAIGVVGALGAVALAVALSPLTPVGEARAAEPALGVVADPLLLAVGGLCILAAVLALAIWPSARASHARAVATSRVEGAGRRASVLAAAAARAGAPPPAVIGVRHALERGRGHTSVPVATALVGAVLGVTALTSTAVFGASLTNLLHTPRLYGQTFQLNLSGMPEAQARAVAVRLAASPGVERVDYGLADMTADVDHLDTSFLAFVAVKGPPIFEMVAGREPTGTDEVALGTQTLGALHAHVGSVVTVRAIGPAGLVVTPEHVVGEVVIPPTLGSGGLGDGGIVPFAGAVRAACGTSAACRTEILPKLEGPDNGWGMGVQVAPTAAGRAVVAEVDRRLPGDVSVITPPVNLVNFGDAVNFPLLLGATLALFAVATLLHLLLVSVTRRRREHALLKVLGFVRRQVRASVCWQAATVGAVGVLFGVPLGIAAGRVAWHAFATGVGAVPLAVVPAAQLAAIGAGSLLVGVALALLPAALAGRLRPGAALRGE